MPSSLPGGDKWCYKDGKPLDATSHFKSVPGSLVFATSSDPQSWLLRENPAWETYCCKICRVHLHTSLIFPDATSPPVSSEHMRYLMNELRTNDCKPVEIFQTSQVSLVKGLVRHRCKMKIFLNYVFFLSFIANCNLVLTTTNSRIENRLHSMIIV